MEKFSKIASEIKPVGTPDQHGNEAYSISFTDGTNAFFKCKTQDLFTVGEQSTFYIDTPIGKSGKPYNKIMRVSAVENEFNRNAEGEKKSSTSEAGNVSNKDTSEMINRSVAIKAACDLLNGSSNNTPDRALECAELFYDYIQFGVTDKQPANVAAAIKSPSEAMSVMPQPDNVLPF